jgi:hypothetical protein
MNPKCQQEKFLPLLVTVTEICLRGDQTYSGSVGGTRVRNLFAVKNGILIVDIAIVRIFCPRGQVLQNFEQQSHATHSMTTVCNTPRTLLTIIIVITSSVEGRHFHHV